MPQLTKDQFKVIIKNAPQGTDPKALANEFISRGYDLEGLDSNAVRQQQTLNTARQTNQFEQTQEDRDNRSFLGKTRDVAGSIVGGDKLAEGAGQALATSDSFLAKGIRGVDSFVRGRGFNTSGVQDGLEEAQKNTDRLIGETITRLKEARKAGDQESVLRFNTQLKNLTLDSATSADASTDFTDSLATNREVIGSATRLAGTLAGGAIAGGTSKALGGTTGIAQGLKVGAAAGAVEGSVQVLGMGIEDNELNAAGIAKSTAGGAIFGGVTGGVVGGVTGGFSARAARKKELKELITNGTLTDARLATKNFVEGVAEDGTPTLTLGGKDKLAKEAVKQGVDDAHVAVIKAGSAGDKKVFSEMLDATEAASTNRLSLKRPSDVSGKNITSTIKFLGEETKTLGTKLDGAAQALKGKAVESADDVLRNVDDSIAEIGANVSNGKIQFDGSDLEDLGVNGKIVQNIYRRLNNANDAYDFHRLKKYIDANVTYGKTGQGLTGEAETLIKGWRKLADDALDTQFPTYNSINTQLSELYGTLDEVGDIFGKNFRNQSELAASIRAGSVADRILGNSANRGGILQTLQNIQTTANKFGLKSDQDIVKQVIFSDVLEDMFGTQATRSLQGQATRAGKEVAAGAVDVVTNPRQGLIERTIDIAGKGIDASRGINRDNAVKSLRALLK